MLSQKMAFHLSDTVLDRFTVNRYSTILILWLYIYHWTNINKEYLLFTYVSSKCYFVYFLKTSQLYLDFVWTVKINEQKEQTEDEHDFHFSNNTT